LLYYFDFPSKQQFGIFIGFIGLSAAYVVRFLTLTRLVIAGLHSVVMPENFRNSSSPMPDQDEWRAYKFPRYEVERRGHEGTLRELVDDMKLKNPGRFDDL
jgi:hypothetical protein